MNVDTQMKSWNFSASWTTSTIPIYSVARRSNHDPSPFPSNNSAVSIQILLLAQLVYSHKFDIPAASNKFYSLNLLSFHRAILFFHRTPPCLTSLILTLYSSSSSLTPDSLKLALRRGSRAIIHHVRGSQDDVCFGSQCRCALARRV